MRASLSKISALVSGLTPIVVSEFPSLFGHISGNLIGGSAGVIGSFSRILPRVIRAFIKLVTSRKPRLVRTKVSLAGSLIANFTGTFAGPEAESSLGGSMGRVTAVLSGGTGRVVPTDTGFISRVTASVISGVNRGTPRVLRFMGNFTDRVMAPRGADGFIRASEGVMRMLKGNVIGTVPVLTSATLDVVSSLKRRVKRTLPLLMSSTNGVVATLVSCVLGPGGLRGVSMYTAGLVMGLSAKVFRDLFRVRGTSGGVYRAV